RQRGDLGQGPVGRGRGRRRRVEAGSVALHARAFADVLAQILARRGRFGLAVTALQVRHHALEAMPALVPGTALGDVGEGDLVLATAEQHRLPHVLGQLVPGRVDVEAVVPGQRLDELDVVRVAPVPAAYGAGRQG